MEVGSNAENEQKCEVTILYDYPTNLQVTVDYGTRKRTVVDIIKSLHKDPCNIGHPLIARSIARYASAVRWAAQPLRSQKLKEASRSLTPEQRKTKASLEKLSELRLSKKQALKNLDQIFKALVHDDRPTLTEAMITLADAASLVRYPSDYFEMLATVLKEPVVSGMQNRGLRIKAIERRLKEVFPETDNMSVVKFLKDIDQHKSDLLLPRRSGVKLGGAALRNTYVAWLAKSDPQTVKTYRSRRGSIQRKLSQLSKLSFPPSELISDRELEHLVGHALDPIVPLDFLALPDVELSKPASLRMAVGFIETADLSNLFILTVNEISPTR